MLLISAYKNKKLLGCSIHFIGNETLYGRYWGCMEEIQYLHFELCYYQAIEFAIENKIKLNPDEYLWQHRRFKSTLRKIYK